MDIPQSCVTQPRPEIHGSMIQWRLATGGATRVQQLGDSHLIPRWWGPARYLWHWEPSIRAVHDIANTTSSVRLSRWCRVSDGICLWLKRCEGRCMRQGELAKLRELERGVEKGPESRRMSWRRKRSVIRCRRARVVGEGRRGRRRRVWRIGP